MSRFNVREISETSLLAALLAVAGAIKIPGLIPGTEFQLSAPLAVAICAVFGFRRYLIAGMLASSVGLILGTQTLLNVLLALVFRLVAGSVVAGAGVSLPVLLVAGPLGSMVARMVLAVILDTPVLPLLAAALPGMLYTAAAVKPLAELLRRVKMKSERLMPDVV